MGQGGMTLRQVLGDEMAEKAQTVATRVIHALNGAPGPEGVMALALVIGAYLGGLDDSEEHIESIMTAVVLVARHVIASSQSYRKETMQ